MLYGGLSSDRLAKLRSDAEAAKGCPHIDNTAVLALLAESVHQQRTPYHPSTTGEYAGTPTADLIEELESPGIPEWGVVYEIAIRLQKAEEALADAYRLVTLMRQWRDARDARLDARDQVIGSRCGGWQAFDAVKAERQAHVALLAHHDRIEAKEMAE